MDTQQFNENLNEVVDWMKKEYQSIRTGQASPAILDGIQIDAYGVPTPLMQVATISIEGPKSLLVSPYDKNQVKQVEQALNDAKLGLSIVGGDTGVRVIFPDLTAERREMLIKLAREKLEQGRVSVRQERDARWSYIQSQEKAGDMSEDEKFKAKEEMEEMVKKTNQQLEEIFENKEKEITF